MKKTLVFAAISAISAVVFATPADLKPANGTVVPTHTELQKSFLNTMPRADRVAKFADKDYRKNLSKGGWYPLPTVLTWTAKGECEVTVARKADGKVVFTTKTADGKTQVDNLEIACEYVWTVKDADGEASSAFRTEDEAPRLIRVPRIPNVRDLGGRVGLGGRRVRQNLVFRSAGLNENAGKRPLSKEEIAQTDPTGALASAGAGIAAYRSQLKKLRSDKTGFVFPKCTLPVSWKVADVTNKLATLDAVLLVAKGQLPAGEKTYAVNDKGIADFSKDRPANWIALSGEIVAEADGYAALGVSADWFWSLEVNGRLVRNYLSGNVTAADSASHQVLVPVKKGANAVRVLLGTGSNGFLFCLRELPAANRDELLEHELGKLKKLPQALAGDSKARVPGKNRVCDENRDYLLNTLGIKSDIDLRSDGECYGMRGSPLGETVTWYHYSSSAYAGMQSEGGRKAFTKVFRVFLDEKNYPIDFHCIAGQDRTGAVAFILNGLLGVDEELLYLDWEATGFWNGSSGFCHEARFNKLVDGFMKNYPAGKTLNEKIELYVKSLGFTDQEIAHFRDIMLEPSVR